MINFTGVTYIYYTCMHVISNKVAQNLKDIKGQRISDTSFVGLKNTIEEKHKNIKLDIICSKWNNS